jgi:hypothetical protein
MTRKLEIERYSLVSSKAFEEVVAALNAIKSRFPK